MSTYFKDLAIELSKENLFNIDEVSIKLKVYFDSHLRDSKKSEIIKINKEMYDIKLSLIQINKKIKTIEEGASLNSLIYNKGRLTVRLVYLKNKYNRLMIEDNIIDEASIINDELENLINTFYGKEGRVLIKNARINAKMRTEVDND